MADPLTHLKQRSGDDWFVGHDSQTFFAVTERVLATLRSCPYAETPLTILLAERDPLTFLTHFVAACAANCRIILANPDWAEAEWQQVFEFVQPDLIWGDQVFNLWRTAETQRRRDDSTANSSYPLPFTLYPLPQILIPTGGTSGNIHFAIHTWETLMASVKGFCTYFGVTQVNSFCVLPLYHVSGLMQFLRSFTTGGKLVVLPFKAVEGGDRSTIDPEDFFLSLVPTQLQRLLEAEGGRQKAEGRRRKAEGGRQKAKEAEGENRRDAETQRGRDASLTQNSKLKTQNSKLKTPLSPTPDSLCPWLSSFHTIFLGGAPAWADLLDRARSQRIRLAPTYGMTETASQIATLKPDDFLNGHTSAGQVLPHAQITIRSPSGEILSAHQIGNITIQATSLAIGYHPPIHPSTPHPLPPPPALFQPDDIGFLDTDGYLHIVGRQSDKIITGGENVFPAEVEAAIRSTGLVQDVCVLGIGDRLWGQAIVAVYVPIHADLPSATIQRALEDKLSKFKRPKHWLAVDQLPRNAQGKVNRPQIESIAKGLTNK